MALIPYSGNVYGPGGASSPGVQSTIVTPNDSDGWAAAEFNPAYQQLADNVATLESSTFPGRNWQPPVLWAPVSSSYTGPWQIVWNGSTSGQTAQQWLFTAYMVVPNQWNLYFAYGTGDAPIAGPTPVSSDNPPSSIDVNTTVSGGTNTDGNIAVGAWGGGFFYLWRTGGSGGLSSFTLVNGTITNISDFKVCWVAGNLVVVWGSTSSGQAYFSSVTGNTFAPMVILSGVVPKWILKSNGTTCLAIPSVAGNPSSYRTVDGTTVTSAIISAIGSTEIPIDVAWNANKQLWLLVTQVTGTPPKPQHFYTSPDGLAWTAISSLTYQLPISSIVASGSYWLALSENLTTSSQAQLIFSPDGVRWYASQTFLSQTGLPTNVPTMLAASPTQVAATGMMISGLLPSGACTYRFSLESGLPAPGALLL